MHFPFSLKFHSVIIKTSRLMSSWIPTGGEILATHQPLSQERHVHHPEVDREQSWGRSCGLERFADFRRFQIRASCQRDPDFSFLSPVRSRWPFDSVQCQSSSFAWWVLIFFSLWQNKIMKNLKPLMQKSCSGL